MFTQASIFGKHMESNYFKCCLFSTDGASHFHLQINAFLWFDFQTHGFTLYSVSRDKCIVANVQLLKEKQKENFSMQGRLLNRSRKHYYATKTWNLCFFFYSFLKVFTENIYKIYFTGNEEWIESETVTILHVIM